MESHIDKITRIFNNLKPGDIIKTDIDLTLKFFKPVQIDFLENILICINDGTLYHFSRVFKDNVWIEKDGSFFEIIG